MRKEEEVYTAVMRWLEFDPEGRVEDMVKIMENVRLPLVQWEFLMGKVSKHKLFTNNEQCRHYFQVCLYVYMVNRKNKNVNST